MTKGLTRVRGEATAYCFQCEEVMGGDAREVAEVLEGVHGDHPTTLIDGPGESSTDPISVVIGKLSELEDREVANLYDAVYNEMYDRKIPVEP